MSKQNDLRNFLGKRNAETDQEPSSRGKVGNRPVNMHIDQTSGQYWF